MAIKVLIVDDALFMRRKLAEIFQREGFEVCGEAENGSEGIKKYKLLKPDLVTMDIVMPEINKLNGIGALKKIIKINPHAKVIIVSSMGQQALIMESIKAGAKDFILKPFQDAKVVEVAKKVLSP